MILKNGATVIIHAPRRRMPRTQAVLAIYGHNLVSWVVDDEGNAFWGRYGEEAVPAFCERCGYDEDIIRHDFESEIRSVGESL